MQLLRTLDEIINYKHNLEATKVFMDKIKFPSDKTRSIDDTIDHLKKEKIHVKYKVKNR